MTLCMIYEQIREDSKWCEWQNDGSQLCFVAVSSQIDVLKYVSWLTGGCLLADRRQHQKRNI